MPFAPRTPALLIFACWLIGGPSANAQENWLDISLRVQGPQEGLTVESAVTIAQDALGRLWFGSSDGLNLYDGYDTRTFKPDLFDSTSVSGTWTEEVFVDREGRIWIGLFDGGLERFDPVTETFLHYTRDPADPNSLSQDTVTTIIQDPDGTLWVGTHGGLNRFDPSTGIFERFRHDPGDPTSLSNDQVRSLLIDSKGTLWVGTGSPAVSETPEGQGGLNRFDRASRRFTRFLHDPSDPSSLSNNKVQAIFEDRRGMLWIGTVGDGLHRMDPENGTFERPLVLGLAPECTSWFCGVSSIAEDDAGTLWIAVYSHGLVRFDPVSGRNEHLAEVPTSNFAPVSLVSAFTIKKTSEGIVWIGSAAARPVQAVSYRNPFTLLDGRVVVDIAPDGKGGHWVASPDYGLGVVDSAGRLTPHPEFGQIGGLGLYAESPSRIWASWGSLFRLDPERGISRQFDPPEGTVNMFRIGPDGSGGFLIASTISVFRFDPSEGSFEPLSCGAPGAPISRPCNGRDVLVDREGRVWVATIQGLYQYLPAEGVLEHAIAGIVQSVYEDRSGNLWLGVEGGLLQLDRDLQRLATYGIADGMPGSSVFGVAEDAKGNIWAQTSGGLVRIDPATRFIVSYTGENGMDLQFEFHSRLLGLPDGRLLVAGANGLALYDPAGETAVKPPELHLTGLRIYNAPVLPGPASPIDRPIWQADRIVLNHDQNDFTIDFLGIHYLGPSSQRYAYMLENHDTEWVDAGRQRSARYSGLSPGTYTFRVRARGIDGSWGTSPASILIVIRPPWWRTLWAYLFYGMVGIAGVFGVDRFQRRRLLGQERERARERELAQAREIERAYGQLKATQEQLIQQEKLASLGELTAGIAHEIKNPLNFVNNFAELNVELLDELEEAARNGEPIDLFVQDLRNNASQISRHGKRADGIVHAMMQHASGGRGVRVASDLNAIVEEYLGLAYHGKRAQSPGFNADLQKQLDTAVGSVDIVPEDVGRVVLNLVSNAFDAVLERANSLASPDQTAPPSSQARPDMTDPSHTSHTPAYSPRVTVSTSRLGDRVEIRVADNGTGIPESVRARVFDPFFTTKPTGSGTGLGLSLSHDIIVKGHGGTLSVDSTPGEGTTFIVSLPG